MNRIFFTFFFTVIILMHAVAQNTESYPYAADDVILNMRVASDKTLQNRYVLYEENLRQLTGSKTDTLISGRRIIPVVVHVIHRGGQENISRAQIEDAIVRLNIDYNKLNADTTAADCWPAFNARRADCQVEFRLARTDPWGNCTDGIVRHYDPQTNYAYFSTMSDYCWLPSRYLNIFTVNFIYPEGMTLPEGAFIGGMSPFPPSNPLSQALTGNDTLADGILIRHDGVGSIGTATTLGGMPINALNRTLTHESGHYFNLYHPFQNLILGIYPASNGCPTLFANGDEVDDTPPVATASQNTSLNCFIPGSRNTCNQDNPDEPDMAENYMDYQWGYCTNLFTTGQYARMNATMQGDRRKLWSVENLIATGVLDTTPASCQPEADFYPITSRLCAGNNISFSNSSYNGYAAGWVWSFPGGNPANSTLENPVVNYPVPGIYDVTLITYNAYGADTMIRQSAVVVTPDSGYHLSAYVEDFESSLPLGQWTVINDAGNAWGLTDSAAFSGARCFRLNNLSSNPAGSYDEFITSGWNLTDLGAGSPPALYFRLAYAGKYIPAGLLTTADTAYDALKVYVSVDCGNSWTEKYSVSGINLATAPPAETAFTPTQASQWREEVKMLPYSYLSEENVVFKFVFRSNAGNNIYIDDIRVGQLNAGIGSEESRAGLDIFPNPVSDQSEIILNQGMPGPVKISLYDISGREVKRIFEGLLPAGSSKFAISRSVTGTGGIFFLKARTSEKILTEKIVIY